MRMLKLLFLIFVFISIFGSYVRLAPSDPKLWHVDPTGTADMRRLGTLGKMAGELSVLDAAVKSSPRLTILAGSVEEGHITYIARSWFWGFPDYISVKQVGSDLLVFSRQRFGRSDLGVNAARLLRWAEAIGLSEDDVTFSS